MSMRTATPKHKTWHIDNNKTSGRFDQLREDARVQVERFLGTLRPEQVINVCECRNNRAWDCTVWYWENGQDQQDQQAINYKET